MNKLIKIYERFHDPLNDQHEQYRLLKQMLDFGTITSEDFLCIIYKRDYKRDLVQEDFNNDLAKILGEEDV